MVLSPVITQRLTTFGGVPGCPSCHAVARPAMPEEGPVAAGDSPAGQVLDHEDTCSQAGSITAQWHARTAVPAATYVACPDCGTRLSGSGPPGTTFTLGPHSCTGRASA